MTRPAWCQDPDCNPVEPDVGALQWSFDTNPKESGFCCGLLPEPVVYERHGLRHENDAHFCFRSSGRGVVMMEVNAGDLRIMTRCTMRTLIAANP